MTLVARLVVLVWGAIALMTVVGSLSITRLENERKGQIERSEYRIIAAVRAQEARLLGALGDVLLAAGIDAASATFDTRACSMLATRLTTGHLSWIGISVTDAGGVVRCSTDQGMLGLDLSARGDVADALQSDQLAVGEIEAGPFVKSPYLPVAIGWRSDGSHGAIVARLDIGLFAASLSDGALPSDGRFIIADKTGRILTASAEQRDRIGQIMPAALLRLMAARDISTQRLRWLDGADSIIGFAPPGTTALPGIFVAVGVSTQDAMAPLEDAATRIQRIFAVTMAAAGLGAWFCGVRFVRNPIRKITEAADRIRDGDRTARACLKGHNELADLARAFDRMAEAIEMGERRAESEGRRADESAGLVRALIDAIPDPVSIWDENGTARIANGPWRNLYVSLASSGTEPVAGHEAAGIHPAIAETRDRVVRERKMERIELDFPGEDGGKTYQMVCAPVVSSSGEAVYAAIIGRDVTTLLAASEQAREAQSLAEDADRAKTRFLAAASHDLRQPLQAALFYAEYVGTRCPADITDTALKLQQTLSDLQSLMDCLLDVSRLDAGAAEMKPTDFAISPLLERISEAASEAATEKGIDFVWVSIDAIVRSDAVMLGRMLRNLVENALRYTERGRVLVDCVPMGDKLRIEVKDSGAGIAKADLERIWEEFHQLHRNPERDRRQGLGLGLAIVQRLGRLLGHDVAVASEVGVGTTFSVTLPLTSWGFAEDGSVPPKLSQPDPSLCPALSIRGPHLVDMGAGRRTLVIEDDPAILEGLSNILTSKGFEVTTAQSKTEAVAKTCDGPPPDFIIADYRLRGGETGTEAVTAVRKLVGRNVPGLILTGERGPDPARDAASLGLSVLSKPVSVPELLNAIC
jgi:signal transduction histidine kinase/HAMP domain-containing protein